MIEGQNQERQGIEPGCWEFTPAARVDVYMNGTHYRRGVVDDVMPDASGFWLAAEGAALREFIDRSSGYQVLVRRV